MTIKDEILSKIHPNILRAIKPTIMDNHFEDFTSNSGYGAIKYTLCAIIPLPKFPFTHEGHPLEVGIPAYKVDSWSFQGGAGTVETHLIVWLPLASNNDRFVSGNSDYANSCRLLNPTAKRFKNPILTTYKMLKEWLSIIPENSFVFVS